MNRTIKTAVSLPMDTYRRAEELRRKEGRSRSEVYAAALLSYFALQETRLAEERYVAGYRSHPEEPEIIQAAAKAGAAVLGEGDW